MPQINVASPFKLQTLGPDRQPVFREFAAGLHDVDEATANHPYVKANLVNADVAQLPTPGTPQAQLLVRQAADAAAAAVTRVLAAAHGKVGEAAASDVAAAIKGEAGDVGPTLADVLSAINDVGGRMDGLAARVGALEAGAALEPPNATEATDQPVGNVVSTEQSTLGGRSRKG